MEKLLFIFIINANAIAGDSVYCLEINQYRHVLSVAYGGIVKDTVIAHLDTLAAMQQRRITGLEFDLQESFELNRRLNVIHSEQNSILVNESEYWRKKFMVADKKWKAGRWLIPVGVVTGLLIAK